MNKKDLDYYLQKFLNIELRKNMNVSPNTIISYKYAFISLLEFIIKKYNKNIKDIKLETINRKVVIDYLEYLELVERYTNIFNNGNNSICIMGSTKYYVRQKIKEKIFS